MRLERNGIAERNLTGGRRLDHPMAGHEVLDGPANLSRPTEQQDVERTGVAHGYTVAVRIVGAAASFAESSGT